MLEMRTYPRPLADRRDDASRKALMERVYGEFHEMPCLRLTPEQARRLFGLRADVCQRVLDRLVQRGSVALEGEQYRFNDAREWPTGRMAIPPAAARYDGQVASVSYPR